MVEAYPLHWPETRKRTASGSRKWGSFGDRTREKAINELLKEISRLGGQKVIISSMLKLRQDGLPYSNQRQPDDPGIAVYFKYKDRDMCFACDTFRCDRDNIWAIKLTIEALRGIERWGSSDMMEQAFTGFSALPGATAAPARHWTAVLGVSFNCTHEQLTQAYREAAKRTHPDAGGSVEAFQEVTLAYEQARSEQ